MTFAQSAGMVKEVTMCSGSFCAGSEKLERRRKTAEKRIRESMGEMVVAVALVASFLQKNGSA